jgi:Mrp family chromosome partitioning ATPase
VQPTGFKTRIGNLFRAAPHLPGPETAPVAPASAPQSTDISTHTGDHISVAAELPSRETPPLAPISAPPQPTDTGTLTDDQFSAAPESPSDQTPPVTRESAPQGVDTVVRTPLPDAPNLSGPEVAPASALPPVSASIDEVIAALYEAGEVGRRVAVIGCARKIGTTLTAIALARTLSRTNRVVLVDLAFASQNATGDEPNARGLADLARGEALFSDIIIRDSGSRAHLVAAGRVDTDAGRLLQSQMLWDAVEALAQSYDYLVLDAGALAETVPDLVAPTAPFALLVCGDTPVTMIGGLAGQLHQAGFAHVAIMAGPPPALEEDAAQSAA